MQALMRYKDEAGAGFGKQYVMAGLNNVKRSSIR